MPPSSQSANDLMVAFSDTVSAGFAALTGPVNAIFGLMITLVVVLTGIQWAVSANREILAGAFSKIMLVGAFAWLINDWQGLSETVFAGFLELGLAAGGGGLSAGDFLNPGAIIETGWGLVRAIGDAPTTTANPLDMAGHLMDALILGIAMIGIMVAFAVLALQIIVTLIEFKIVTLGGFILLPFGIWSKTAFMAERPLGYVIAAGLKVLALAIIVSGAQAVFAGLTPSPEPDIYEALTLLTAAMILAMLALMVPNLAASLITGGPSLGAGSLALGAVAIGGAAGLAGVATAAAGRAGVSALSAATVRAHGAAAALPAQRASSMAGLTGPAYAPIGPSTAASGTASGASLGRAAGSTAGGPPPAPRQASNPASLGIGTAPSGVNAANPQAQRAQSPGTGTPSGTDAHTGGRPAAATAFAFANTARHLLPGNESSGSMTPTLKEED